MSKIAPLFLLLLAASSAAAARNWYEPARASPERRAILDAMRPAIEAQLNAPVVFLVKDMRVLDNWAFVQVMPQRPGGRSIDVRRTPLAKDVDMMDGLRTEAILQKRSGVWRLLEHAIGATDVWFMSWCARVPRWLLTDYCQR